MTDIKVGQKYRVRLGGKHPFSDGRTLEVFEVDSHVHYAYGGNTGLSRHNRSLGEFEAFVREGVLTLVEEAVAPAVPEAAPRATTVEIGARYAIGKHSGPFISNSEIKVTNVDKVRVEYFYKNKMDNDTCTKDLVTFERLMREGIVTKVQEAPSRAPTMPEAMTALYGNPFEVKPKSLFDVDCAELEQRVQRTTELVMNAQGMAQHVHSPTMRMPKSREDENRRYRENLSQALKRIIGTPASRAAHEEILRICRDHLPSRFKPMVQFDESGKFVGVKIRDRGTTDSYYVPPECRPKCPVQPEVLPEITMHGPSGALLDRVAGYAGLHRGRMESDVSLRDRIKEHMLTKGASAPKVNEESNPAQPINKVEKTMSRIVNVFLFDNTLGLKADQRLIGKVENIATDGNDQQVLMEVAVNHDVGGLLKAHNIKRKAIINQDILDRVGKTVYMQPLELAQVTYQVVEVVRSR
jgi:hypothetical protein